MSETQETQVTTEEQHTGMRQMAEMQANVSSQLVSMHLDRLMGIMVSGNGVSFQRKLQAAKALKEAVEFALDFGIGVTNANIRGKGAPLAKETNELSAVLVKAFDNRMLLLADNLRQAEQEKQNEVNNEQAVSSDQQGEQTNG